MKTMKAKVDGKHVVIGDSVGFKCDIEQRGTIIEIKKSKSHGKILILQAPDGGFDGEYIGGDDTTEVMADECWL